MNFWGFFIIITIFCLWVVQHTEHAGAVFLWAERDGMYHYTCRHLGEWQFSTSQAFLKVYCSSQLDPRNRKWDLMGSEGLELQRGNLFSLSYLTWATEFSCPLYYFSRTTGTNCHKLGDSKLQICIYSFTILEASSTKSASLGLNQVLAGPSFLQKL